MKILRFIHFLISITFWLWILYLWMRYDTKGVNRMIADWFGINKSTVLWTFPLMFVSIIVVAGFTGMGIVNYFDSRKNNKVRKNIRP